MDPAMYLDVKENQLTRLCGSDVDDMIRVETNGFKNKCRKSHFCFEMSENGQLPCSFSGFHVKYGEDTYSIFKMDHLAYVFNVNLLPTDASLSNFRFASMELA